MVRDPAMMVLIVLFPTLPAQQLSIDRNLKVIHGRPMIAPVALGNRPALVLGTLYADILSLAKLIDVALLDGKALEAQAAIETEMLAML